jgi:hypothetical protein
MAHQPIPIEARASIIIEHPLWYSAHALRLLHRIHWPRIEQLRERRKSRQQLLDLIAASAEAGQILVIESGRDCDGVEYSGRTRLIEATVAAVDRLDSEIGEWADGPYRLQIGRPSERDSISYESRDLVMAAYEDGHRHVIYSQFP